MSVTLRIEVMDGQLPYFDAGEKTIGQCPKPSKNLSGKEWL